jgi:hypothetical protein
MLIKIGDASLPSIFRANPSIYEKILEFFTARISNTNTRSAYFNAVRRFFFWMEEQGLEFETIKAPHVSLYVESSV